MMTDEKPPKSPWKSILKNNITPKRRSGAPTGGAFVIDIQPIRAKNTKVIDVKPKQEPDVCPDYETNSSSDVEGKHVSTRQQ